MGFDAIPAAAFLPPPLTTVRQHFGELGRCGLELLLRRVQFPDPQAAGVDGAHQVAVVAPELIVRASSARLGR
ncbi:substrate-binding domain-containing protein [Streptomyces tateyamensis]|uniref:substrate-binding domain-containing protein n=1 Tax=Streptomyces tateyamensis TaxID=565073 RepID=UPI002678E95B